MPELPEVEMARRFLESNVVNRRVVSVEVIDDGVLDGMDIMTFQHDLVGRSIVSVARRGKQMFVGLDDGSFLTVHLGMTGELSMDQGDHIPTYTRIVFGFEDGDRLYYSDQRKFGAIGMVGSIGLFVNEHGLGPDALSIDRSDFTKRVSGHRKAIKSVLLDQRVLSGIGNLYADEVLFQVRLHPATRADTISQKKLNELHRQILVVLRRSIKVGSDFAVLPVGYLLKVREPGADCPRGNGKLAATKVGGRTSIFCPACQRLKGS
jgi:formamidopyrimidine-DNA glycosylase